MVNGLKHYQGGALLPLSPLKRVIRISETRITLSDPQPVLVQASCMIFELLGQIPQSLCRLLDCMDGNSVSQACGMSMIWASRAVPFCRVWLKLQMHMGLPLWVSWDVSLHWALRGHLASCMCLFPHWVFWLLGRALPHLGLPSFTGWTCLGGCLAAGEVKIWWFYPFWQSCNCRGKVWALVLSAGEDAVLTAEVPSDGPDSRELLRFF